MAVIAVPELLALQGLHDAFEGRSWEWSGHAASANGSPLAHNDITGPLPPALATPPPAASLAVLGGNLRMHAAPCHGMEQRRLPARVPAGGSSGALEELQEDREDPGRGPREGRRRRRGRTDRPAGRRADVHVEPLLLAHKVALQRLRGVPQALPRPRGHQRANARTQHGSRRAEGGTAPLPQHAGAGGAARPVAGRRAGADRRYHRGGHWTGITRAMRIVRDVVQSLNIDCEAVIQGAKTTAWR